MASYNSPVGDYYGKKKGKPCMQIDIESVKEAGGISIGDEVTLMVKGKVKSLEAPKEGIDYGPEGGKTKMMPGCIVLEVDDVEVTQAGSNADDD